MNERKKTITFDPKNFISSPYVDCPDCKKTGVFGVLSIGGNRYTRRCKECWHTDSYSLPKLTKKIIYLDQFAISEMMKAINANLGKKDKVAQFWLTLFKRLDWLLSKQLIICPDSQFHERESLVSHYKALKRMYEHLSRGTTFYDPATIKRFQIATVFKNVVGFNDPHAVELTASSVIHGRIDEWEEKFIISVNFAHSTEEIESLRASRASTHDAIAELSQRWRAEPTKKFDERYHEEAIGYGRAVFKRYIDGVVKCMQANMGQLQLPDDELVRLIMGEEAVLITSLQMYLPRLDDPDQHNKNTKTIGEFLQSDAMLTVPFNHIAALLWAGVAHRIANDSMRKAPNRGMVNDLEMLSVTLPYCDAMFIDNDARELLNYADVRRGLKGFPTRVFSLSNKEEFLEYLDQIETEANPAILAKAQEVYGDPEPFVSMYEREDEYETRGMWGLGGCCTGIGKCGRVVPRSTTLSGEYTCSSPDSWHILTAAFLLSCVYPRTA